METNNQNLGVLIPINESNGQRAVNARDLYLFLGYDKSQWSRWYTTNIINNEFAEEGIDYQTFDTVSNGNPTKDFALSIDFAKELSMLARNEKGKQARRYFIACERGLVQIFSMNQKQQQPTYSLEDKFKAIELSCKLLRKSKASKARMVNAVIVPMGLPAFDYIESEGQFLSAKDLLEMHPVVYKGKKLASITFNKILIEKGYMEVAAQPKGKTDLKLLTDKGLKWGRNDDSPEHPGSIIAHYNVKKFPAFLQELNLI